MIRMDLLGKELEVCKKIGGENYSHKNIKATRSSTCFAYIYAWDLKNVQADYLIWFSNEFQS